MGCPKRSEAPLCRLVGCRLVGCRLVGCRLVGCRLVGSRLVGSRLVGIGLWGSVCGLVDRSVYGEVGSKVYRLVGRGPVGWGPYQELIHRQILRGRCDRMRYFVSGWNFRVCLFEILASRR